MRAVLRYAILLLAIMISPVSAQDELSQPRAEQLMRNHMPAETRCRWNGSIFECLYLNPGGDQSLSYMATFKEGRITFILDRTRSPDHMKAFEAEFNRLTEQLGEVPSDFGFSRRDIELCMEKVPNEYGEGFHRRELMSGRWLLNCTIFMTGIGARSISVILSPTIQQPGRRG